MIKLNLIPPKVREAERLKAIVAVGAILYAAAFLWLGSQWMAVRDELARVTAETDKVQAELNAPDLTEAVKAVQKFSEDLDAVKAKASKVNQFRKDQATLVQLLDSMPDWTLNGQVWFNKVVADGGKGKRTITLDGEAVSRPVFAAFYELMDSQQLVKDLQFASALSTKPIHGVDTVAFTLKFSVGEFQ
jgi:Tfp pilus assembly protein PilN